MTMTMIFLRRGGAGGKRFPRPRPRLLRTFADALDRRPAAEEIREFCDLRERRVPDDGTAADHDLVRWIAWGREQADRLDPVTSATGPVGESFTPDRSRHVTRQACPSWGGAMEPRSAAAHLFVIDDLDEYAGAHGIKHERERTGPADHVHDITWTEDRFEQNPRSPYVGIDVSLSRNVDARSVTSGPSPTRYVSSE